MQGVYKGGRGGSVEAISNDFSCLESSARSRLGFIINDQQMRVA